MLISLALSPNGEIYLVQPSAIVSVSQSLPVGNGSMRLVTITGGSQVRVLDNVANNNVLAGLSMGATVRPVKSSSPVPGPAGPKGKDGIDGKNGADGSVLSLVTILAAAYPVGSLYFSTNGVNPASALGFGTWAAFGAGRVPVGLDVSNPAFDTDEEIGGALTVAAAGANNAPAFTGTPTQATSAVSAGTPAGTVAAPVFTGSALPTHQHELPFTKLAGATGALRMLASSIFGTGTSRAPESVSAAPTANTTAAPVALDAPTSAGTPAGTNSAPVFTGSALGTHAHTLTPAGTVAAPVFTGSATSVVQPYIVVRMWKRTA